MPAPDRRTSRPAAEHRTLNAEHRTSKSGRPGVLRSSEFGVHHSILAMFRGLSFKVRSSAFEIRGSAFSVVRLAAAFAAAASCRGAEPPADADASGDDDH